MLDFDSDIQELTNIKVIGCGGGGSNAVNRMIVEGLKKVVEPDASIMNTTFAGFIIEFAIIVTSFTTLTLTSFELNSFSSTLTFAVFEKTPTLLFMVPLITIFNVSPLLTLIFFILIVLPSISYADVSEPLTETDVILIKSSIFILSNVSSTLKVSVLVDLFVSFICFFF